MFSRMLTLGVVLASVAVAPAALAGDKHGYRYDRAYDRSYDRAGPNYDYARVVSANPIVRQVRVEVPQRECWTEDRYEEPRPAQTGLAGPTILGGLIGGALGTRFGNGDGRRAATVAGVLIGSAIGRDIGARQQVERSAYSEPRITSVERCGVRYIENYEERVEGYDVEYEYAGQRHHTRLPYDPGDRMRIRVAVSPAEDGYSDRDDD